MHSRKPSLIGRSSRIRRPKRAGRRDGVTPSRDELVRLQLRRFRAMLRAILPANRFYAAKFSATSVDPRRIRSLDQLTGLPFTTKAELLQDQTAHPPYGSNLTYPLGSYNRLHESSGTVGVPLRWLDTPESWDWFLGCWQTIYDTIGLRPDDRLFFPFSFGPFIGFWGAFEAAARRGSLCLPGGGMSSAARLRFMVDNGVTVVACTPTYALRLAEVAAEEGIELAPGPVRSLVVAGEPGGSIPATRSRIEAAWGARVFDHAGMTEIGATSVECVASQGGLHLIETEYIGEVIDRKTLQPVRSGQEGELVLTNLGRLGSPLIRYRTGDIVRLDPQPCPCGSPWLRLDGGILGRADDMVFIRGNNLYPAAVEELMRSIAEVAEYRCTVETAAALPSLRIEVEPASAQIASSLAERIGRTFKDRFNFRAEVQLVAPGSLPRFDMKARRWVRA